MMQKQPASQALEAYMDQAIRRCRRAGYRGFVFEVLREQLGTIGAIERLVCSGQLQSGFKRMQALGLLEWTAEYAAVDFRSEFKRTVVEAAEWRLQCVRGAKKARHRDCP